MVLKKTPSMLLYFVRHYLSMGFEAGLSLGKIKEDIP